MEVKFKNLTDINEGAALAIYFNLAVANIEIYYNKITQSKLKITDIISKRESKTNEILADFIWDESKYRFYRKVPPETLKNNLTIILTRLSNLRNYYSHVYHSEKVLEFGNDERDLINKFFNNAAANVKSDFGDIQLFNDEIITKDGVVWFLSLFLYNYEAQQCYYNIHGLKRNDDKYKPKRNLFSFYSQEYKTEELKTDKEFLHFHKIIQYLNRNPFSNPEEDGFRKTNKFIHFAVKYLDDFNILPGITFLKKKDAVYENEYQYLINRNNIFFEWQDKFNYSHIDKDKIRKPKKLKGIIGYQSLVYLIYAVLIKDNNITLDEIRKYFQEYITILDNAKDGNEIDQKLVKDRHLPKIIISKIKSFENKYELKEKVIKRIDFILDEIQKNGKGLNRNNKKLRPFDKISVVMKFINDSLTETQDSEKTKKAKAKFGVNKYKEIMGYVRFYNRDKQKLISILRSGRWKFKNENEIFDLLENNENLEELFTTVTEINKTLFNNLKNEAENGTEKINEIAKILSIKNLSERNIDDIYISGIKSNGIALPADFIKNQIIKNKNSVFYDILEKKNMPATIPLNESFYSEPEDLISNTDNQELKKKVELQKRKAKEHHTEDILLSSIAIKYLGKSERFETFKNILSKGVNNIWENNYSIDVVINEKRITIDFSSKSTHLFERLNKNRLLIEILKPFQDGAKISISDLVLMEQRYHKDRKEFVHNLIKFEEKVYTDNKAEIEQEESDFNLKNKIRYFYLSFNKILDYAKKRKFDLYFKLTKDLRNAAFHNLVSSFSYKNVVIEWNRLLKSRKKEEKITNKNIFFNDYKLRNLLK